MFSTLAKIIFNFLVTFILLSANAFLDQSKILSIGKQLTVNKNANWNHLQTKIYMWLEWWNLSFDRMEDSVGKGENAIYQTVRINSDCKQAMFVKH